MWKRRNVDSGAKNGMELSYDTLCQYNSSDDGTMLTIITGDKITLSDERIR